MTRDLIHLTAVQKTGLTTLYGKALDARVPAPILGDTLADQAVGQLDFDFATLKMPKAAMISLPVRAKQLDGWTAEFVADHPTSTVLHLGCGLDTRAFRVDPPETVAWYDIDLPEMVDLRRQLYPERPGYHLVSASVTDPAWLPTIPADHPVLVVAEGLVMHVPTPDMVNLFQRITERFPGGAAIFDVYSALTARIISWGSKFGGTPIHLHSGLPQALAAQAPAMRVAESVPYLTLPDLVDHLNRNAFERGYFRLIQAGWTKHSILHLRYRF